jgi:hypothetical protein
MWRRTAPDDDSNWDVAHRVMGCSAWPAGASLGHNKPPEPGSEPPRQVILGPRSAATSIKPVLEPPDCLALVAAVDPLRKTRSRTTSIPPLSCPVLAGWQARETPRQEIRRASSCRRLAQNARLTPS